MKNIGLIMVAIMIIGATSLQAKNTPRKALKVPSEVKAVISQQLDYPKFAEHKLIEGEVWLKVCIDEASKLKIIDLSATNPELGNYVRTQLSSIYIGNSGCKSGQAFYLKVKFDLTEY